MPRKSRLVRAALYLLFLALLALPSLADTIPRVEEGTPPMPEIIFPNDSDTGYADPRFISPNRLLNAKGELELSLYQPGLASMYETILAFPEKDGCIRLEVHEEPMHEPLPQWHDLESMVHDARWVLRGRVTGLAPGFNLQHAGTLVRIAPDEWMKGEATLEDRYILFPTGEFMVGDKRICAWHGQWPPVPALGDEMILLLHKRWSNMDGNLLYARGPQVLVLKSDAVLLPAFLKDEDPELEGLAKSALLERLREIVEEQPE